MFKRIMLTLTFLAAFGAVGAGFTNSAEAWRAWRRPYAAYYYGPPAFVGPPRAYVGVPYRAYYAPRVVAPYRTYYAYPDYYYYGPGPGVSVAVGF